MKFTTLILSALTLAGVALATPAGAEQRRATRVRKSNPNQVKYGNITDNQYVEYSDNWSGAIQTAPPAGHTFTAVTGTFTVPKPTPPTSSGAGSWSAAAWVGIDGDTCQTAILQTGVDFTVTRSSSGALSYSYDAWYEWFPAYSYDFSGISVSAGDVIVASVVSSSSSSGTAYIDNLTTGQSVSKALTSSSHLCGTNAEWIVEDFEEGNSLVALANFGTVEFTGAVAKSSGGSSEGTSGGTIIEIEGSSGNVETTVSLPGSSEVMVKWT